MTVRMASDVQNGRKPTSIGADPMGMRHQKPTVKVRVRKLVKLTTGR